jgi:hypothetical protein
MFSNNASSHQLLSMGMLLAVILTGCTQTTLPPPSDQPSRVVPATAIVPIQPTSTLAPPRLTAPAAPAQPSITRAPARTSTPPKALTPLTLKITSPQDESTVDRTPIAVIGQTTVGAVVSVDGILADVDASGKFQATVTLDMGPNLIVIVASDENGNELDASLLVNYEP